MNTNENVNFLQTEDDIPINPTSWGQTITTTQDRHYPTMPNDMPNREQIKDFYLRFVKAKKSFDTIKKTEKNDFGNYKYANLQGVIEATEDKLLENNILLEEQQHENNLFIYLVDLETGFKFLQAKRPIIAPDGKTKQNLIQQEGSGITYLRRYLRMIVLGLITEDDDGHSHNKPPVTIKQKYNPEQIRNWHKQIMELNNQNLIKKETLIKLAKLKQQECKDDYGDLMFSIIREIRKDNKSENDNAD